MSRTGKGKRVTQAKSKGETRPALRGHELRLQHHRTSQQLVKRDTVTPSEKQKEPGRHSLSGHST